MYAGITYCTVIAASSDLFDLRRAEVDGRTHPAGATPSPTSCRIGATAWSTDASSCSWKAHGLTRWRSPAKCDQLSAPVTWDTLGSAYYQLAERAIDYVAVRRAEGRVTARPASPAAANRACRCYGWRKDAPTWRSPSYAGPWTRRRSRPACEPASSAYVEIMIASGDVVSARAATDELGQIAEFLDAAYLRAVAASAARQFGSRRATRAPRCRSSRCRIGVAQAGRSVRGCTRPGADRSCL